MGGCVSFPLLRYAAFAHSFRRSPERGHASTRPSDARAGSSFVEGILIHANH